MKLNLNLDGRPRRMADVVGQKMVTETLSRQMKAGTLGSSYILEGHFGCGKTTSAYILAMFLNCENPQDGEPCGCCPSCKSIIDGENPDVVDINASKETRKDDIVAAIIDYSQYQPLGKKKVFIVDECQSLSAGAWGALLKTLEEPPEYCKYFFCTTNAEKIPAAIVSRSQKFHFSAIPEDVIADSLTAICKSYGWDCSEEVCRKLAHASNGAMRDGKKLLNMLADEGDFSDAAVARILFGDVSSHTYNVANALCRRDPEMLSKSIDGLRESGETDFSNGLKLAAKLLSDAMEVKYNKNALKNFTDDYGKMAERISGYSLKDIALACDALFKAQAPLRLQNDSVTAKVALICELDRGTNPSCGTNDGMLENTVKALTDRVFALEKKVKELSVPTVNGATVSEARSAASPDVMPKREESAVPSPIQQPKAEVKPVAAKVPVPEVKVAKPADEPASFVPVIHGPMMDDVFEEEAVSLDTIPTADGRFKKCSVEDFF